MAIIASEGQKFTPAPAGVHQAVCVDVVDLGIVDTTYKGEAKRQHKVKIVWQIDELMDNGKPFLVQNRYTLSLGEKAALRADLESWRGRQFTADELKAFDVEKVIGINCQLNIVHETKNGNTYANVKAVMPIGKGMQPMVASKDYIRAKDRPAEQEPPPPQDEFEGGAHVEEDQIPF